MRSNFARLLCLGALALVVALPATAGDTVPTILKEGKLRTAYNPVLLHYLVEEGVDDLDEALHKEALDQLVTALKAETTISAGEETTAALITAGALLAEALGGGGLASEMGDAASDATHSIYEGWIDAADSLLKAGYTEDAVSFYEHCMARFPYQDLQGRCAMGLARSKPDEAIDILIKTTEGNAEGAIKSALWSLGGIASSDALTEEQKTRIIEHIKGFAGGLKKASYGRSACEALVRTGHPSVTERLGELKGGMMNQNISPCALRGLLLTFDDRSVVKDLAKKLKGGMLDTTKPADKLFAARTLLEAGEDAGFEWTLKHVTNKKNDKDRQKEIQKAAKKNKKPKWKKPKEGDLRSSVVTMLVETGGERALEALRMGFAFAEKDSWIETWTALGLYRLGDDSHVDLINKALQSREWDYTTLRIAEAFAEKGDFSGVPALKALYAEAVTRADKAKKDSEQAQLRRLRSGIAYALARIDRDDCAPIAAEILGDKDASVRTAAAYALASMSGAKIAPGLVMSLAIDYGETDSGSRTPIVHAHVARSAAAKIGTTPELSSVLDKAAESSLTSVKFLALSARHKKP